MGVAMVLLAMIAAACSDSTTTVAPTSRTTVPGQTSSTAAAGTTTVAGGVGAAPVPVAVSANHRYLVDQHGKPFMIVGDSPQCLSTNLSTDDMDFFFADRQAMASTRRG